MSKGTSTQSHRLIRLDTTLGKKTLIPVRFNSSESISGGFSFSITAFSETRHDLTAKDLVANPVTIGLVKKDDSIRYFNGFVQEIISLGSERDGQKSNYKLHVVSWAQLLMTKRVDTRIFQEKNVEDILKEVFSEYGNNAKFKFTLKSTHVPRRFCVQYNETDWNFFNRLCEQEGLAYYFKHKNGEHKLHIIDDASGCEPLKPSVVKIQSQNNEDDFLSSWQNTGRFVTGKYSQRTYNYLLPKTLSPAEHVVKSDINQVQKIESYQYSEFSHNKTEASTDIKRKASRGAQKTHISTGSGNCRHLIIATHFELALANGGEFLDKGKEFTFSKVNISADDTTGILNCHIEAIPKGELIFTKAEHPQISGLQTAVVTGPAGEEIHTDELGRIKVQFHWDRLGKLDEKSTCYLRVMQSFAGPSFGAHFTPRIGQEVVVAFENGNPDRPFVIGGLYHQENKPPYADQKGTRAGIRSRSTKGGGPGNFNELYFEDTKGSEEVYLQAEKDHNVWIKNDENIIIDNDKHQEVAKNETNQVGENLSIKVGKKVFIDAGTEILLQVGGSAIKITGSKIEISSTTVDVNGSTIKLN